MAATPVRTLVVDDSMVFRKILSDLLKEIPGIEMRCFSVFEERPFNSCAADNIDGNQIQQFQARGRVEIRGSQRPRNRPENKGNPRIEELTFFLTANVKFAKKCCKRRANLLI